MTKNKILRKSRHLKLSVVGQTRVFSPGPPPAKKPPAYLDLHGGTVANEQPSDVGDVGVVLEGSLVEAYLLAEMSDVLLVVEGEEIVLKEGVGNVRNLKGVSWKEPSGGEESEDRGKDKRGQSESGSSSLSKEAE